MREKLWGDNFFDAKDKKWRTAGDKEDGSALKRAFVQFMMEPVIRLCKATMNNEMDKVEKMLKTLEITLKAEELKLQGKHLMKNVFQKWINAAEALLEMIIMKLPSPVAAQKYRMEYLYEGPTDDVTATAIKNCDP